MACCCTHGPRALRPTKQMRRKVPEPIGFGTLREDGDQRQRVLMPGLHKTVSWHQHRWRRKEEGKAQWHRIGAFGAESLVAEHRGCPCRWCSLGLCWCGFTKRRGGRFSPTILSSSLRSPPVYFERIQQRPPRAPRATSRAKAPSAFRDTMMA